MPNDYTASDTATRAYWRKEDYHAVAKFLYEKDLDVNVDNVRRAAIVVFGDMNPGSLNKSRLEKIQENLDQLGPEVRRVRAVKAEYKKESKAEARESRSVAMTVDAAMKSMFSEIVNNSNVALESEMMTKLSVMFSRHSAMVQGMLDRQQTMIETLMKEFGVSPKVKTNSSDIEVDQTPVLPGPALTRRKVLVHGVAPIQRDQAEAWLKSMEGALLTNGIEVRFNQVGGHVRKIEGHFNYIVYFTNSIGKNGSDWLKEHCDETWPVAGSASTLVDRLRQLLSRMQSDKK